MAIMKALSSLKKRVAHCTSDQHHQEPDEPHHPSAAAPAPPSPTDNVPPVDTDDAKPTNDDEFKVKYRNFGREACDLLLTEYLDTKKKWTVWTEKPALKVDKTDECLSGTISGRGFTTYTPDAAHKFGMDFVEKFLWDNATKTLYDEHTDAMLLMMEIDDNTHIVDQIFKGRFGFAGRDFVVCVHKMLHNSADLERLVIGARSISEEDVEHAASTIESQQDREKWAHACNKLVRGTAYIAGFIVELNKTTGEFKFAYINDADAKTVGVPKWIVDRVKIDQLKIVQNIPKCLIAAWNRDINLTAADDHA